MRQETSVARYIRSAVRWGTYPLSWAYILGLLHLVVSGRMTAEQAVPAATGGLVIFYVILEWLFPCERRWGATWRSFFTDLSYIALNAPVIAGANALLAYFTIRMTGGVMGPATDWPIWLQLFAIFAIFEACQYMLHRYMHEGTGRAGDFLWRVHAAHHLPQKLYVFMHVVGHPINSLLIQVLVRVIPVWLMGYDERVVAAFAMVNALHGIISHFNVDVRMGWLNYIFVGPELHRYHHSSDLREAKNFGATLSVYDWLFGTAVYKPGQFPEALGAADETLYPSYRRLGAILRMPFTRGGTAALTAARQES